MTQPSADISDVIRRTDEILRQHAATPSALDTVLKKHATAGAAAAQSAPLLSPAMDKMKPGALPKALPSGISGGKVAAIVAGVALAGGTLYAVTRKKEPKTEMGQWTVRVNGERAGPQMSQSFDR